MAFSRKPGCGGTDPFERQPYSPGPLGYNDFADPNLGDWPLGNTPGPLGISDLCDPFLGMGSPLVAQIKDEFKLLKGKITDTKDSEYLEHVGSFFGSYIEYEKFAVESDAELNANKGLRKLIELHGEAQTIFYRWVRKAYMNRGVEDVPGLIKRQQSKELADALKKVKVSYGKGFTAGGFNPRPMKDANYRYRLGTVSEHGMGTAVDIEDHTNPVLSLADWKFIEDLTGTKPAVVRSLHRWEDKPEDLWQDIANLSDLFVKSVAANVKQIEDDRALVRKNLGEAAEKELHTPKYVELVKEEAKKKATAPQPAVNVLLKDHPNLLEWTKGFFTLDKKLVLLLHEHKFTWGATFSNVVDLHHFELPGGG
jgi:hypothetical protein